MQESAEAERSAELELRRRHGRVVRVNQSQMNFPFVAQARAIKREFVLIEQTHLVPSRRQFKSSAGPGKSSAKNGDSGETVTHTAAF